MDTYKIRNVVVPTGLSEAWSVGGFQFMSNPEEPQERPPHMEVFHWSTPGGNFSGFRANTLGTYRIKLHLGFVADPRDIHIQVSMCSLSPYNAADLERWVAIMGYPNTTSFDLEGEVLFDRRVTDTNRPVFLRMVAWSGRDDGTPVTGQLSADSHIEIEYLRGL